MYLFKKLFTSQFNKKIVDGPTCFPGYENHKQQES